MRLRTLVGLAIATATIGANAQDGEEIVPVMPEAASACPMPAAVDPIDPDVEVELLVAHQGKIKTMQSDLAAYRECLESVRADDDMTEGNLMALNQAHDTSVEIEEKAAANFNEAVQAYKKRKQ